ncbi:protein transport protein SEC31-like [Carassius auratus]|uniref:Protein transport protein SEC31-like n=1 Tax=Carassius auratus TaxID=7957 RepID=A0A6P6LX91_CARAU|nr:protein transport protein SEC31-like [Carassius auratus]
MALFRSLFKWIQCYVHCIPKRRTKKEVQRWTVPEWAPMEGVSRPFDVGNIGQIKKNTKEGQKDEMMMKGWSENEEIRQAEEKRKIMVTGSEHETNREDKEKRNKKMKEEETKDPTPLRIEVKPQPTPPATEIKTLAGSPFIKSSVEEPLVAKRVPRHLPPLATETRSLSSREEPLLVQRVSQHPALPAIEVKHLPGSSFIKSSVEEPPLSMAELPVQSASQYPSPQPQAIESRPLQSVDTPLMVQEVSRHFAPKATETKPLRRSFVVDPEMVPKTSRHQAQPATESWAVPQKLTLKQIRSMSRSTSSKSPEGEPPMVHRASLNLVPPAIKSTPLQPVAERLMIQRTSRHFAPKPAGSFVQGPKMVQRASQHLAPPAEGPSWAEPTPESLSHSVEKQSTDRVMVPPRQIPKCVEVKPKSAASLLVLMDIESGDDEFVEHTETQIPFREIEKADHEQTLDAVVKQKGKFEKVHPKVLEQSSDSGKKTCGDSKAEALQKELDERLTRLFCVDYNHGPKKENQQCLKGQEKPKTKGKIRAGPFSWAEKKLKRLNKEKKSEKDGKTQNDLFEEFLKDPKSLFNIQPYL